MLNTDAHNPRLTGQARMTKAQFIEGNRRTPDLAPLSEEFMSQLYDEIVVNEIKIEGGAEELEAAASPQPPRSPARPGLEGGRQRRRSLSDMFDTAPVRSRARAHGDGDTLLLLRLWSTAASLPSSCGSRGSSDMSVDAGAERGGAEERL